MNKLYDSTSPIPYSTIILDIGDVLFSWSAETETTISPKTLKRILESPTWYEFEKGLISQDDCYSRIGEEFDIQASEVAKAFQDARDSLTPNTKLIALIKELKAQSLLTVIAMSNISQPDYEYLRTKSGEWSIFDYIYISAAIGERKPNLGFYEHVITSAGIDPRTTVFVDDKPENVSSARSLGMQGIVFDNFSRVATLLQSTVTDPITRAWNYLETRAGHHQSYTNTGVTFAENFAQLLVLEATRKPNLVNYVRHTRLFNFFQSGGILTTKNFPYDLDTTSIGLTVTDYIDSATKCSVMDEMLTYVNEDGVIQVYFDHCRPRIDPVVCVNILTLFYANGRGSELHKTLDYVYSVLRTRKYLDGTRYYAGAEPFLYFLGRLISRSDSVRKRFEPLFQQRVRERIGTDGDSLALAMRILACSVVGVVNDFDLWKLLTLQTKNGSWQDGWFYKYGSSGILIGNHGLTTALAISAIESMKLRHEGKAEPISVIESGHDIRGDDTYCYEADTIVSDVPVPSSTDSRLP